MDIEYSSSARQGTAPVSTTTTTTTTTTSGIRQGTAPVNPPAKRIRVDLPDTNLNLTPLLEDGLAHIKNTTMERLLRKYHTSLKYLYTKLHKKENTLENQRTKKKSYCNFDIKKVKKTMTEAELASKNAHGESIETTLISLTQEFNTNMNNIFVNLTEMRIKKIKSDIDSFVANTKAEILGQELVDIDPQEGKRILEEAINFISHANIKLAQRRTLRIATEAIEKRHEVAKQNTITQVSVTDPEARIHEIVLKACEKFFKERATKKVGHTEEECRNKNKCKKHGPANRGRQNQRKTQSVTRNNSRSRSRSQTRTPTRSKSKKPSNSWRNSNQRNTSLSRTRQYTYRSKSRKPTQGNQRNFQQNRKNTQNTSYSGRPPNRIHSEKDCNNPRCRFHGGEEKNWRGRR